MFQCRSCFSFCLMQCVKLILCTCLLACMHTHCNCSEGKGIVVSRTLVLGLLASHAHAFNDHETPIDTTCKLRTVARQWNKRPWVPHNSQQYCSHDLPMCCLYVPLLLVSLWWYATSSSRPCTKRLHSRAQLRHLGGNLIDVVVKLRICWCPAIHP